ncbi:MAG: response regulator [Terriglobales bacterium]
MARKILLADDSVTAQNMGRKILADAGYDVVTVNNGSAAIKRIAELKPDLIVLDVYMPGYSGLEVCQRLKDAAETARIPVLLTVGKLEPFKVEEARRVRADAHIVKPFEASELLSAITRLEDRVVPQSAESDAGADTGWVSRLSFPSKKKKAVEPDDVVAGAAFRDFRRGKGKTGASGAVPVKAAPPEQDPGPVPDIPRDITPEELDALSELAAKLDGRTTEAENTPPPAEQRVETSTPVVEPAAESVDTAVAVEPAALAVKGKSEVEVPVEKMEPAVEGAVPVAAPAAVVAVSTAHLAQEPAPVDTNDEPMFASAASAVEQAEEGMAGKPSEAEEPAPSDAELAEALRLLTPSTGRPDVSTVPSHGTLVAAGQLLAEEAAHNAAVAPRWIAEPVALSTEEAALSLEAEMFRTFAAMPATLPPSPSGADLESAGITGVAAIAAAVENRLSEAGLAASSKVVADGAVSCSKATAQEASAEEAPAEAIATVSTTANPAIDGVEAEKTEHQDSPAKVAEQVLAEALVATAEEAPKAMAAAAAADGGASVSDARAVADIVDSVLADLRPKLLEEIAKKLARK